MDDRDHGVDKDRRFTRGPGDSRHAGTIPIPEPSLYLILFLTSTTWAVLKDQRIVWGHRVWRPLPICYQVTREHLLSINPLQVAQSIHFLTRCEKHITTHFSKFEFVYWPMIFINLFSYMSALPWTFVWITHAHIDMLQLVNFQPKWLYRCVGNPTSFHFVPRKNQLTSLTPIPRWKKLTSKTVAPVRTGDNAVNYTYVFCCIRSSC